MDEHQLDPKKGREVADQLRKLGTRGILVPAAEQLYITELECRMPKCYCPEEMGGKTYFAYVPKELPDWMPTVDHIALKSEGGKLTVDNVRLAHRLCNRIHYAETHDKPHEKDLQRVERARELAIMATEMVGVPRDERFPGRRDKILRLIGELWERYPGMRFGQLVEVLLTPDAAELFNMEDDDILRVLKSRLGESSADGD